MPIADKVPARIIIMLRFICAYIICTSACRKKHLKIFIISSHCYCIFSSTHLAPFLRFSGIRSGLRLTGGCNMPCLNYIAHMCTHLSTFQREKGRCGKKLISNKTNTWTQKNPFVSRYCTCFIRPRAQPTLTPILNINYFSN